MLRPEGSLRFSSILQIPESQAIPDFNPTILLIVILGSNLIMAYGLMKQTGDEPLSSEQTENLSPGQTVTLEGFATPEEEGSEPDDSESNP